MEGIKKIRWFYLVASFAIIGMGLLLICAPGFIASVLGYIAGAALILFGIAKVVSHFFSRADLVDSMLVGVLLSMFGFVLILNEENVMDYVYMFIGILILLDGIFKLKNAFQSRRAKQADWLGVLIAALVVMAFGILIIIITNFFSGKVIIILLGVSVLLDGLQNLYSVVRYAVFAKDKDSKEKNPELDGTVEVEGKVVED